MKREDAAVESEDDVDPVEFVKAMLNISPEDAAKARERAAAAMEREDRKRVADTEGVNSPRLGDEELFRAWWEWHRLSRGVRDERKSLEVGEPESAWAAYWQVREWVSNNEHGVVDLLVALNQMAPIDDDGFTIGAGELENLLSDHGDAVIDDVERSARENPQFARALTHARPS